jgi:hypothetical protein
MLLPPAVGMPDAGGRSMPYSSCSSRHDSDAAAGRAQYDSMSALRLGPGTMAFLVCTTMFLKGMPWKGAASQCWCRPGHHRLCFCHDIRCWPSLRALDRRRIVLARDHYRSRCSIPAIMIMSALPVGSHRRTSWPQWSASHGGLTSIS